MKNNKRNDKSALTARQRREQKAATETKMKSPEVSETPETDEFQDETLKPQGNATILGMPKKRFFLVVISVFLAITLIILGIVWPLFYEPYGKDTVAVITLNDGTELKFKLNIEECPHATWNFIYLAKKGYFNGSIIYDVQKYSLRFGGFMNDSFEHRSNDDIFMKSLKDITIPENRLTTSKNVLSYRVQKDNVTYTNNYHKAGFLCYLRDGGSGEFQINAAELTKGTAIRLANDNSPTISKDYQTSNIHAFGEPLNDETMSKIVQIYEPFDTEKHGYTNYRNPSNEQIDWFRLPKQNIVIKSVIIHSPKIKDWRDFNFDEVINNTNYISWTSTAYDAP